MPTPAAAGTPAATGAPPSGSSQTTVPGTPTPQQRPATGAPSVQAPPTQQQVTFHVYREQWTRGPTLMPARPYLQTSAAIKNLLQ